MKTLRLSQITESNDALNTTSLSKFEERVSELKSNIQDFITDGLCGEFDKLSFDKEVQKLAYYVNSMYILSDEDYMKFEDSLCDEFGSFLNSQLS